MLFLKIGAFVRKLTAVGIHILLNNCIVISRSLLIIFNLTTETQLLLFVKALPRVGGWLYKGSKNIVVARLTVNRCHDACGIINQLCAGSSGASHLHLLFFFCKCVSDLRHFTSEERSCYVVVIAHLLVDSGIHIPAIL